MEKMDIKNRFARQNLPWVRGFCKKTAFWGVLLNLLLFAACTKTSEQNTGGTTTSPDSLVFHPANIQYAKGFSLEYHDTYKILKIFPHEKGDTIAYILLPKGLAVPEAHKNAKIVRVPVERMVLLSTSHVGFAAFADATDRIIGLESFDYVNNPNVWDRIEKGQVKAVGGGASMNMETMLSIQPDLVMVSGMGSDYLQPYQLLEESGIPVVVNVEWTEHTALARAEWCKLMAALLNEEEKVNERFAEVERNYLTIKEKASKITETPEVVIGLPFKDSWFVPGKKSYVGDMLRDAGATWGWANDTTSVSLGLNLEQVYPSGLRAPFWIGPGEVQSMDELKASDPRLAKFLSVKTGQVYNNNKRLNPRKSGNDYWESGVVYPDKILADLVAILHPEIMPNHEGYFFKKLE
jgi:iron complex transport system substrate-binding protein